MPERIFIFRNCKNVYVHGETIKGGDQSEGRQYTFEQKNSRYMEELEDLYKFVFE
jgi:hypothetical protein